MKHFEWTAFYMEFADVLLTYRENRAELIEKMKRVHEAVGRKYPTVDRNNLVNDIDPFTIFGMFNKGLSDKNRIALLNQIALEFHISAPIPQNFDGIPVLNNQNAAFYWFDEKHGSQDIHQLWTAFDAALLLASEDNSTNRRHFIENYDIAVRQKGVRWKLTMGLFWIRPYFFVNLDSTNRYFLCRAESTTIEYSQTFEMLLRNLPNGEDYLQIRDLLSSAIAEKICPYESFPEFSFAAWSGNPETIPESDEREYSPTYTLSVNTYTKENFLSEVYLSDSQYTTLTALLMHKKNVILQGAPGVGKTFAAKRLAYSIMGEKDDSRIQLVQFHQNYSYEDFVMGYRPVGNDFELQEGIFYKFCERARQLPKDKPCFFLIDEINRGNLSKVFGELLMLIEKSHRGEEITLSYEGRVFSVPENVYIIGMMNTADRSLALIDYALRRRFSFFDMSPAFDNELFRAHCQSLNLPKLNNILTIVQRLNTAIRQDATLGEGFRIGHSYFCDLEAGNEAQLCAVVEYDIIPMLKEYWFDDEATWMQWADELRGGLK